MAVTAYSAALVISVSTAIANAASVTCEGAFSSTRASRPTVFSDILAADSSQPLPYGKFTPEYFDRIIPEILENTRTEIERIKTDPERPTFENTIERLMAAENDLYIAFGVLSHLTMVKSNPQLEEVHQRQIAAVSEFSNSVQFDRALFERIKVVYDRRNFLPLTKEQKTILKQMFESAIDSGINLPEAKQDRLKQIHSELAQLSMRYGLNSRKSSESYFFVTRNHADLVGLSAETIERAKSLADSRGETGAWTFSMQPSTLQNVFEFAESRELRREIFQNRLKLAAEGPFDNRPVAIEIARLRLDVAEILGHKSFAAAELKGRMAQTPETVLSFLRKLQSKYRPAAERDARELQEFAWQEGFPRSETLQGWDLAYYSRKLETARYQVDSEKVREYLPFESVLRGAIQVAERMHGIRFESFNDPEAWDPSVKAYRVRERKTGRFVGLFYVDPYFREGKRGGAWSTTTISSGEIDGVARRPHVVNVLNLNPPTEKMPSLLTVDEVRTVFHEIGHGLHQLLSQTRFRALAGTSVLRDFVELPSQLNEEWGMDTPTLRSFALHYKTGEPIPMDLIEKIRRAANFRIGTIGLRQVFYAALDMAWHSSEPSKIKDVEDIAKLEASLSDYFIYPRAGLQSTAFNHIFDGGYSAGYYSYKWAEVLAADAFEYFTERGIYTKKIATRYRRDILSKGGTENPAVLYRRFRGRDADPEALIRREGLE